MTPDLGDVPTWISALAAVCALAAAIWAARSAKKTLEATTEGLDLERERDRQREALHQRAQAELVAAVPSRMTVCLTDDAPEGGRRTRELTFPAVEILNRSNLPVFEVEVRCPELSGAGLVRPGSSLLDQMPWDAIPSELSRSGHEVSQERTAVTEESPGEEQNALLDTWERYGACEIAFTDAAGRRWVRTREGHLREGDGFSECS